jgi:hydroxypyruvate isomerase
MPRLCANLKWLFTELPFLDRFAAAARSGFDAVEYASPYEYAATDLKARLRDNGLRQVLINSPSGDREQGFGSGFACIPGQRQVFRDSMKRAFDHAAALDCPLVHLMAGIRPPAVSPEVAATVYADNVGWAADEARGGAVHLVLEAINGYDVPGFFLETEEQAATIVEALGRDRLGLQFDIYHAQIAGGDVTRRMARLMPLIDHMQIADVPGRNEPGTGELGWEFIFRRIDELGYRGHVGCEYRPVTETVSGLAWRERYGLSVGAKQ